MRAHHLLCILGFRRRGYSQEFIDGMDEVVSSIKSHPDTTLELKTSPDAICRLCPHLAATGCNRRAGAEESVRKKDLAILEALGLRAGMRLRVSEVYEKVRSSFHEKDLSKRYCARCRWLPLGFCTEGLRRLNEGKFFLRSPGGKKHRNYNREKS